ncbi:MAG: hypothetical protein US49_C0001G0054 [candidate division TM6 bacterium GW2011_GWF2_37_49]|nr:MAG: hypothetical protein US49_C0001G0054 [candidate division TM6 bacterium GW2011_GWF2_37_49]
MKKYILFFMVFSVCSGLYAADSVQTATNPQQQGEFSESWTKRFKDKLKNASMAIKLKILARVKRLKKHSIQVCQYYSKHGFRKSIADLFRAAWAKCVQGRGSGDKSSSPIAPPVPALLVPELRIADVRGFKFDEFECINTNWVNVDEWCDEITDRIGSCGWIQYSTSGQQARSGYIFIIPELLSDNHLYQDTDIFNGDQIACQFFEADISRSLDRRPMKFAENGYAYFSFFTSIVSQNFDDLNEILSHQGSARISDDLTGLQQFVSAAKKSCGSVFKMHLQVKKEYLPDFSYNFAKFLLQSKLIDIAEDGKITGKINNFKIYYHPSDGNEPQNEHSRGVMPRIVVYLTEKYLPDPVPRHNYLNSIVDPIIMFVKYYCTFRNITLQDLAWPFQPRMNYKINDVVYIAGDSGDYKLAYQQIDYRKFPIIADFYTPDFNFVTGFEYQYIPPAQRGANPQ